ncbi:MAG: hypothetical protein MI974_29840 [Chitinophagales bacterium]|nr:hypothetical protein [Chitinophagales bacterium]
MDDKYIKEHSVIERYLTGQLTKEELDEFSFLLMKDKNLLKEVQVNRQLFKTLWAQQSDERQQAVKKPLNWKFLLVLGGIILVFGCLLYFIGDKSSKAPSTNTIPSEQPTLTPPDATDTIEQKNHSIDIEKEKISPSAPKSNNEATPTDEQASSQPLAANFEPNPMLENYIGQLRGGELVISKPPQSNLIISKNGKSTFQLEGTYNNKTTEELMLYFFSNKKEDYEQFQPLLTTNLKLEQLDDVLLIKWEQELDWPEGLYYYQIEGADSGLLYAGKFEIR